MTGAAPAGDAHGWAGRARQAAASWPAPAVLGCALGLLGAAEQASWLAVSGEPAGWFAVRRHVARAVVADPAPAVAPAAGAGLDSQAIVVLMLLCLATTVPLGLRRPAAAAVAVCAATAASLAVFGTLTVAGLAAQLIAVYRLGRHGSRVLAPALALPFLILAASGPAAGGAGSVTVLLGSLGLVAALAGIARRARGEAAEQGAAQQLIAGTLLEHTVRGERARIARELHDVVAHHISMIAVQAETARLATPGMPPDGAQRLRDIGDTARSALTEMRRLLGVLREDAPPAAPGGPAADRQPQPGLRELNELLDAAREAAGTGARLILRGAPAPLGPGAELAVYRIVQEALTNARRHAPGAAVDVELHYTGGALRLRIRDDGPGPAAGAASGHGLPGMRERAAAAGGELRAGPASSGGFLVEAVLPVKAEGAA